MTSASFVREETFGSLQKQSHASPPRTEARVCACVRREAASSVVHVQEKLT